MQHTRMFLSMKYVVPQLANKKCIQYSNIKPLEYLPLLYTFKWPVTRTVHSKAITNASVVEKEREVGFIRRLLGKMKWLNIDAARAHAIGTLAYENIVDKIDYSVFYKDFNMSDTYYSWFLVTELHVWMLMVRYMAEKEHGQVARNALVETMWVDASNRVKLLGPIASSVRNKQLLDLSNQFNATVIVYDEGLMSNDKVLASALWERFFNLECNNPEFIERLLIYVRKQIDLLDRIPSSKIFRDPKTPWIKLKDINIRKIHV